jgi:protein SCO1/2
VDPERDTPEVLAAYGKRYQANPARWTFLTGPQKDLHALSRDAFKLGDVTGDLEHSTRFVLVDRKSRIRGYYNTWEKEAIPNLLADIQTLLKEPQ